MHRLALALILVLAMVTSVPVFACADSHDVTNTATATGGAGGNATISLVPDITVNQGGDMSHYNGNTVSVPVLSPSSSASSSVGNVSTSIISIEPNNIHSSTVPITVGDVLSPSATGGNANVTNNNENKIERGAVQNDNTNKQKQQQGQLQGQQQQQGQLQGQGQKQEINNGQTISPTQSVVIDTPRPLLGLPSPNANVIPQLSFGEVKMVPPFITDARLLPWNGEIIIAVVSQKTTKVGKVIKTSINLVNEAARKEDLTKCRIIMLAHPSTKMWSTGGSLSAGGANTVGTGGMSGAGGILPTFGRMTADTIIDLLVVRVVK